MKLKIFRGPRASSFQEKTGCLSDSDRTNTIFLGDSFHEINATLSMYSAYTIGWVCTRWNIISNLQGPTSQKWYPQIEELKHQHDLYFNEICYPSELPPGHKKLTWQWNIPIEHGDFVHWNSVFSGGGTSILTTWSHLFQAKGTDNAARWLGPIASCSTRKSGGGTPTTDQKRPEKYRAWVSFSSASPWWSQMSNENMDVEGEGAAMIRCKNASKWNLWDGSLRGFCSVQSQCPPGWLLFFGSSKTFQLASWEWKHPYPVDQSFHTPGCAEFSINPRKRANWMTQVFWFCLANSHSIISWGGGKWGKHPNFEDKVSPNKTIRQIQPGPTWKVKAFHQFFASKWRFKRSLPQIMYQVCTVDGWNSPVSS